MVYLVYLLTGAVAGSLAGLLGIGGGLLIVPVLVLLFDWLGVAPEVLTHLALGTSLATIVATSSSSTLAHHGRGGVRWDLFRLLVPGVVVGSAVGVWIASLLSGSWLQAVIGLYALGSAIKMFLGAAPGPSRQLPGASGLLGIGLLVGFGSALFGIGGGSLLVPILVWCNLRMQEAVGTAAATGLPLALVGAVTNVWAGWGEPLLPGGAVGFVHLPAAACIVLASLPCARWGALLAHRLPAQRLRRVFALFLAVVGSQLIFVSLLGGR